MYKVGYASLTNHVVSWTKQGYGIPLYNLMKDEEEVMSRIVLRSEEWVMSAELMS